jgi:hypothetical protein
MKLFKIVALAALLGCASQSAQSANQPRQGGASTQRSPTDPGTSNAEQGTGSSSSNPSSNLVKCERDLDCPGGEACVEQYCRKQW